MKIIFLDCMEFFGKNLFSFLIGYLGMNFYKNIIRLFVFIRFYRLGWCKEIIYGLYGYLKFFKISSFLISML